MHVKNYVGITIFINTRQENVFLSGILFYGSIRRMVELRIKEVAMERGVTTAYQLQKLLDLNPAQAARLWRGGQEMIALKTIDALCESLDCEPSDLIIRIAKSRAKSRKSSSRK